MLLIITEIKELNFKEKPMKLIFLGFYVTQNGGLSNWKKREKCVI